MKYEKFELDLCRCGFTDVAEYYYYINSLLNDQAQEVQEYDQAV